MPKLIILSGLPASGKSTRAAEIIKESGNTFRVNRDELRTMLFPGLKWSGQREDITKRVERQTAAEILRKGYSVVVDDTNLNTGNVTSWTQLAAENGATAVVEEIKTAPEECIYRDWQRFYKNERSVGPAIIWAMALKAVRIKWERPLVIVDLDGTLADTSERLHFLRAKPKDWVSFHRAGAIAFSRRPVVSWVQHLWPEYEPIIVSGRDEDYQRETADWLGVQLGCCRSGAESGFAQVALKLFMRRGGDHRDDTEIKADILRNLLAAGAEIAFAIDDRKRIVDLWRSHGIKTYQVGDDNSDEF